MDEILKMASELGRLIAQHDAYKRLRAAEIDVQAKPETRETLEKFEQQRRKIGALEASGKPVEVEDKHELQRLAEAVHGNANLQALLRAQADYLDIMNRINRAIRKELDMGMEQGAQDDGQA